MSKSTWLCCPTASVPVSESGFDILFFIYFCVFRRGSPWLTLAAYDPLFLDCLRPQHLLLLGGLPSKYSPGPALLSFRDRWTGWRGRGLPEQVVDGADLCHTTGRGRMSRPPGLWLCVFIRLGRGAARPSRWCWTSQRSVRRGGRSCDHLAGVPTSTSAACRRPPCPARPSVNLLLCGCHRRCSWI